MKKFNLERALAGDPVVNRHGDKVKIIHVMENAHTNQTIICIHYVASFEHLHEQSRDGAFNHDSSLSNLDLFMAEKPKKKYYMAIAINQLGEEIVGTSCMAAHKEKLQQYLDKIDDYMIIEIELEV